MSIEEIKKDLITINYSTLKDLDCRATKRSFCLNKDCKSCYEKSFASDKKSNCWLLEENSTIPRLVSKNSNDIFNLKCDKCNHKFQIKLCLTQSRFCPYCSLRGKICYDDACQFCLKKSFASSEFVAYLYEENIIPRHIFINSPLKFKFKCPQCKHIFETSPYYISRGRWCHYCNHIKLCDAEDCDYCLKKSFASCDKAQFWSKLNTVTPRQVFKHSAKKCWFDCNICLKPFESTIYHVSDDNSFCPYCKLKTEKMVCDYLSIDNEVVQQMKFPWSLNTETGCYMRYDLYIEKYKIIVEIDGPQHFRQAVSKWLDYKKVQELDRKKII